MRDLNIYTQLSGVIWKLLSRVDDRVTDHDECNPHLSADDD